VTVTSTSTTYRRDHFYVGGRWVEPVGAERLVVVSPSTEEPVGSVPAAVPADIDAAVSAARHAFDHGPWPLMTQHERAAKMRDLAAAMRDRVDETATAITSEMGSVISYTRAGQAPAPIDMLEYYAGLAGTVGQPEEGRVGAYATWTVTKEPVGVVGAIVPWNGPIFLAMFKIAPALLAGCTIVLKPSPESPLSAYLLAEALEAADFPPGVLNIVPGDREVGRHLVRHPDVDKIAFTGSTAAGKAIMADCANDLKRVTLELGGKSPAIVLDDADLDASLPGILFGFCQNNGQICVSNSRLVVPRSRRAEIVDAIAAGLGEVNLGDPFDEASTMGPLVAQRQRDRVMGLLDGARSEGATIAYGGGAGGMDRGWYVAPTLVTDVVPGMTIARDEVFGPVLSIIDYDTEDEAIAIANDTDYGLGAAIFTTDTDRYSRLARRVRAGTVNLNAHLTDYHLPFGGWKQSGIGVEGGPEAVENYLETKVLGPF
jgi:aldehyde dehydrogenase (NAD+)